MTYLPTHAAQARSEPATVTVLALGNSLLGDDGAGAHVLRVLRERRRHGDVRFIDGGTLGFSLAPLVEDSDCLIVLDAARMDAAPGSVGVLLGSVLDDFLARKGASAHEVGLRDLFDMARLRGRLPRLRALVGIEPAHVEWGLEPSAAVAAALEPAADEVERLLARWLRRTHGGATWITNDRPEARTP